MPMQPRPRAETLRPLRPSSRNCMMNPFKERAEFLKVAPLIDADEWLLGFSHTADLAGWNSSVLHIEEKLVALVAGERDEQSAGGLRIEKQCLDFHTDCRFVADRAFGEVAIVVQAAGNIASANALQRSAQDWNVFRKDS